jgi:hypothetical protein
VRLLIIQDVGAFLSPILIAKQAYVSYI